MQRFALVCSVLVAAFVPAAAVADTSDDVFACENGISADVELDACKRVLRDDGVEPLDLSKALLQVANSYRVAGDQTQALANYDRLIAQLPARPADAEQALVSFRAFGQRGETYVQMEDQDHAIADFNQAIKLDSDDFPDGVRSWTYNERAWTYHLRGDDAAALPDAEKSVELNSTDWAAVETRAEVYEKLGRIDEAVSDYNTTLSYQPGESHAVAGLARISGLKRVPASQAPPSEQAAKPAPPNQPSAQSAPTTGSAAPADQAVEIAFWNSIAPSKDRADFEAYLKQFPQGSFAALARNRLSALAAPQQSSDQPANPDANSAAAPETFTFKVCNSKTALIGVTVVTSGSDGASRTRGWWAVNPNDCREIGPFKTGDFYFGAQTFNTNPVQVFVNGGKLTKFCVGAGSFDMPATQTCAPGDKRDFSHARVTTATMAWTL